MPYTPENNPYMPGDPYAYDLKWIVSKLKGYDTSISSIESDIDDIEAFIDDLKAAQISGDPWNLKNKKLIFFGDSITYGYNGDGNNGQVAYPYPKTIATITGASVYNKGVSGATMARKAANVNDLKSQLENATSLINTADMIFIACGLNDYIQSVPVSAPDSMNWENFNGAMYNAIDYIRTFNSTCEIIFIAPWANQYYFNNVNNSYGANIRSYIEAIRAFCARWSFKFIDPPERMGVDATNWTALTVDNTHYTQAGYMLAALCVLYNIGGNDTTPKYKTDNVFEPLSIPNYNEIGQFYAYLGGTASTQNSYNDFTFEPGLYKIELDILLDSTDYDVNDGYVGCHIFVNSTSLSSPIGLIPDGNYHHFEIYKYLTTTLTGKLAFRAANSAGVTITDLFIKNVKITPLDGQIVEHDDVVELPATGDATGSVKVLRKDGRISVYIDITPTANIAANTALTAASNAYQKIANAGESHYFPVMKDATTITRAGISASNTCNVTASLTTSNRILGAITY